MYSTTQAKPGALTRATAIAITRSRFAAAAMAALTAGGVLAAASEAAFAGGTAPACIVRGARGPGYMQIINKCSKPMTVQVRLDWAGDRPCRRIAVGGSNWFRWSFGLYDKTTVC